MKSSFTDYLHESGDEAIKEIYRKLFKHFTQDSLMTINGVDYSGFIDYDRVKLKTATYESRILWLKYRVAKVLTLPLDKILPPTGSCHAQVNSGDQTFNLCGVTLVACAIEALGHFLTGDEDTNGDSFKLWVKRYMPNWGVKTPNGVPVPDWLWKCARNGMAHALAFANGGTECNGSQPFVEKVDGQIQMDPFIFYEDFKKGVDQFFEDLQKIPKLQSAFEKRFKSTLLT